MAIGTLDSGNLNGGQKLAVKYFIVAMVLFGAQILFGLLAGIQYLKPGFLYGIIDFSINRMVHINAMVVWMLCGFIGSVYWLLEDEARTRWWAWGWATWCSGCSPWRWRSSSWSIWSCRSGRATATLWLITEGREYIEAPRWADIGIVVCVLTFFYNVAATFTKGRFTGVGGVLVLDLVALFGLYLAGMFYTTNVSVDQYWWWWVIHLWVEATWEVLVGAIMAYGLMKLLGGAEKSSRPGCTSRWR